MVWNPFITETFGNKGEQSLEVAFVEGCFYKLFILNLCAWAACVLASLASWVAIIRNTIALPH